MSNLEAEMQIYEKFCKPKFIALERGQNSMVDILKGKDGDPGLLDEVRSLRKIIASMFKIFITLGCAFMIQFVIWLFDILKAFFK